MVVDGSAKIIKYLLFFFNFVFVVTGLILIVVGAVVEYKARNYLNFLGDSYVSTAVLLIILGVVVFLIAFLGCCGASKENLCMIRTFTICLTVLFIMELAGGIAAYVKRNELEGIAKDGLENAFEHALKDQDKQAEKGWDEIQNEFHCCGFNSSEDYPIPDDIPMKGCCKNLEEGTNCTVAKAYTHGCRENVIDYFKNNIAMVGGAGVGIAFVEVIGIIFACCLIRGIKAQYEVV